MPIDTVEGQRKLAAILAADVAGYSKLMADDERATVSALKAAREVFRERVEAHAGRLIDTTGDSVLAEFRSPVEAVQCAVEIQRQLKTTNAPVPDHRKMFFRIGVNLGDVIEEADGTIYGDGVNVAARLEGLAEPGGIMLADVARQTVEGKLDVGLADAGEHEVKNIAKPVRAWRVLLDGAEDRTPPVKGIRRPKVIAGLAVGLALVIGLAVWGVTVRVDTPQMVKADGTATDDPVLAMPTGPSIAVLPFSNLSGDPEQDYFADGITGEVISRLAEFNDLFIYSQGATYAYKDTKLGAQEVGRELRARFVLTGSIRRSKNTVRIDVELLDSDSGQHLWSETYDRDLTAADILEIQDEIGDGVAAVLGGTFGILTRAELVGLAEYQPTQLDSYECILLARHYMNVASLELAKDTEACLERVVGDDPRYADAWGWLSYIYMDEMQFWSPDDSSYYDKALNAAQQAIALDVTHQRAHLVKNILQFHRRDCTAFLTGAKDTLRINPNNHEIVLDIAFRAAGCGDWDYSVALVEKQVSIVAHPTPFFFGILSWNEYKSNNYEAALEFAYKAELSDFYWSYIHQAVALAQLGRVEEARIAAEKILELYPDYQDRARSDLESWFFAQPHLIEHWLEGLEKAGLFGEPEAPSRPIIAVLPFDNMSGDPEQEYFADGITEDIITRMSEFQELGVIARNSTFQYKGQAVDVRAVADALGADYVLEGSIQRGGDTIRVTTQLIDASDGTHLWAESYERTLTAGSIFEVQDQITTDVSGVVADRYGIVMRSQMRRVGDKASVQLTSYECVLRAADYIFDPNQERYLAARDCLIRVTAEEPDYADAWAAWSEICSDGVTVWADETLSLDQSVEFANRAIQIDAEHPHAHWALSYAYFAKEDFDQFLVEADRAIELDPNNSAVVGQLGALIAALGKWDRGIALLDGAIKLNPNYQPWLNYAFVGHHIRLGAYDTALPYARDYVARAPDFYLAHLNMVWTLGLLGRADEAKPYIDQLNAQFPDFRNEVHAVIEPWYFDEVLIAKLYEGLRGSGMDVSEPPVSP